MLGLGKVLKTFLPIQTFIQVLVLGKVAGENYKILLSHKIMMFNLSHISLKVKIIDFM